MDDVKVCLTISKLNDLLEELDDPLLKNSDITADYLGSKILNI